MKEILPPAAFISETFGVSAEAFRAQRMAELENLAKYRAAKLKDYQDWVDADKRMAKIAEAERQQAEARKYVSQKSEEFARMFDVADKKVAFKISPLIKLPPAAPKEGMWQKIRRWLKRE